MKNTEANIQLYPNPNNGEFRLHLPNKGIYDVIVLNVHGSIVHRDKLNGGKIHVVHLSDQLPSGNYIIQVKSDGTRLYQ